jgi:hypothetical protein
MAVSPTHGRTKNIPDCICCGAEELECCYEPYGESGVNHAMGWVIWNHDGFSDGIYHLKVNSGSWYTPFGVGQGTFKHKQVLYENTNFDILSRGRCSEVDAITGQALPDVYGNPIVCNPAYSHDTSYVGGYGQFWHHPDQDDVLDSNFDKTHPANTLLYYTKCHSTYQGDALAAAHGDINIQWLGGDPVNRTDWEDTFYKTVYTAAYPDGIDVFRNTMEFGMAPVGPTFGGDFIGRIGYGGYATSGRIALLCLKRATETLVKAIDIAKFFAPWMPPSIEYGAYIFPQDSNGHVLPPWGPIKKDSWYIVKQLNSLAYGDYAYGTPFGIAYAFAVNTLVGSIASPIPYFDGGGDGPWPAGILQWRAETTRPPFTEPRKVRANVAGGAESVHGCSPYSGWKCALSTALENSLGAGAG